RPCTASAPSTRSTPTTSSASTRSTTPCCTTTASTSKAWRRPMTCSGGGGADVVLVGVARTAKTPTSIYLANRGVQTGNVPIVPGVEVSRYVEGLSRPLVVGLYPNPDG